MLVRSLALEGARYLRRYSRMRVSSMRRCIVVEPNSFGKALAAVSADVRVHPCWEQCRVKARAAHSPGLSTTCRRFIRGITKTTAALLLAVKHRPDFAAQILGRERLLDEVHPFFEHALVGDDVARVARHEQALDARIEG